MGSREWLRRWSVRLDLLAILVLVVHVLIASQVFGQSQETINERQRLEQVYLGTRQDDIVKRLTSLEDKNLPGRLGIIESDMYEVKWLARGLASALIIQLVMAGLETRRKGKV